MTDPVIEAMCIAAWNSDPGNLDYPAWVEQAEFYKNESRREMRAVLAALRSEPVLGVMVERGLAGWDYAVNSGRARQGSDLVRTAILAALTPDEGGTDPAQPQSGGE